MRFILILTVMWLTVALTVAFSTDLNVTVAQDGTGDFKTIMEAVLAAPETTSPSRFTVFIKAGTYDEYVTVDAKKVNLTFIGEGRETTIISGNRSNSTGYRTYNSATLSVKGNGFVAQDITFQNTATDHTQAVAVLSEAEQVAFYRCRFLGFQDTLYTKKGLQFFRDCDVWGTVDFIFGDAAVVFQNCQIYARNNSTFNTITITAQGREYKRGGGGTILQNCTLTAATPTSNISKIYLGRPWKLYSRVVVMQSFLDGVIDPTGWVEWPNHPEYDSDLYYGEFENRGLGANTSQRVKWTGYKGILDRSTAASFSVRNFILGDTWIPSTGIPFYMDLI